MTLPINRNQRCEVVAVSGNDYYSQRYSDYTYYAKPDMKNAYLVAYNALTPEQAATNDGNVFLDFKPVMTTIEVVVKGRAKVNEEDVQVTGISVVREVPEGDGDTFTWNAETGETTNKMPKPFRCSTDITASIPSPGKSKRAKAFRSAKKTSRSIWRRWFTGPK